MIDIAEVYAPNPLETIFCFSVAGLLGFPENGLLLAYYSPVVKDVNLTPDTGLPARSCMVEGPVTQM